MKSKKNLSRLAAIVTGLVAVVAALTVSATSATTAHGGSHVHTTGYGSGV